MEKFFKSKEGSILISIIWGFGLAALFHKSCKGNNCIIIKGPDPKIARHNVYATNNSDCVKLEPYIVSCENKKDGEQLVKDVKQLPLTKYEDDFGYEKYVQDRYQSEYDVVKYKPYEPTPLHNFNQF